MTAAATPLVRTVRDEAGREWYAYVVIPTRKLGAPQRAHWLALETTADFRFIAPVPEGWDKWSDAQLLTAIRSARTELRH
jgi:hypothetical protein